MRRYLKQLTKKCKNPGCLNAFCRTINNSLKASQVAKILSQYHDLFICRNIEKKLGTNSDCNNKNIILDLYFYLKGILNLEMENIEDDPSVNTTDLIRISDNNIPLDIQHKKIKQNFCYETPDSTLILFDDLKGTETTFEDDKEKLGIQKTKMKRKTKENSENTQTKNNENDKLEIQNTYKIMPCQGFNHQFCSILNTNFDNTEIYLLSGIFYLILNLFRETNNSNLALIILKLFNVLIDLDLKFIDEAVPFTDHHMLEETHFQILIDVFETIYTKISMFQSSPYIVDSPCHCKLETCLFKFNLTNNDFLKSFHGIKKIINNFYITDIRLDDSLYQCFEIYRILYQINDVLEILNENDFILKQFYSKISIKSEIRFTKINFNSCLKYNFAIPIHIKAEILKAHNNDIMKSNLQDAFFRALFEGITEPYLFITVRREFIYNDSLKFLSNSNENNLRKQLKVRFLGEEGVDSGGIKKEFFLLLSHEIENDMNSFRQTNNRIWFRKNADLETLYLIGKMLGIALYNDVVLGLKFPGILFKKLLNISLEFEDLEEIEPEIYYSLKSLNKSSDEDVLFLDQTFRIDLKENGICYAHDLIENGDQVKVDKKNLKLFQQLYANFFTEKFIKNEFDSFKSGFNSIINFSTIQNFKAEELEKIIMGVDDYDFEKIKSTAIYNGYDPDEDRIISHFWSIFHDFNISKKKKLIQFITGNDRLPIGGSKMLHLTIMRNGCDTDRLPSSQTCFNTLLLPEYSSKKKLKSKLETAINLTAGFFLM